MQLVHDPLWGNADGTDEESYLLLDNHVDQLRQLALRIIVLWVAKTSERNSAGQMTGQTFVLRAFPPT